MPATGKLIEKEGVTTLFEQWELRNDVLRDTREQALKHFTEQSFPTTRHEEWKYTNIKKIADASWDQNGDHQVTAEEVKNALFTDAAEVSLIVLVNGQYMPSLSSVNASSGITVAPLSEALKSEDAVLKEHLAKYADNQVDAFTSLNTAFASEGVFVHVPRGKAEERPVVLLHLNDSRESSPIAQPRSLVVVGENAQATLVEQFASIGEGDSFTNSITEVVVAKHGHADHYKIQVAGATHHQVGTVQAHQEDNSYFANTTISLTGGIIRNNLNIAMDGEHCEAFMNGLFLLDGKTHVDNHTAVDHRKPNCESNELYKGLVDGQSKGVFNGKIFVREHAQKTNAFQSNNNLILSDKASIDTKPQLEIWADDVKCSHGATIGALDEEPLFYLRARGIPEASARSLLMYAFAGDVLERIKVESVRRYVDKIISSRLGYTFGEEE